MPFLEVLSKVTILSFLQFWSKVTFLSFPNFENRPILRQECSFSTPFAGMTECYFLQLSARFATFAQNCRDQAARSRAVTGPVKRVVEQERHLMTFTTFRVVSGVPKAAPRLKTVLLCTAQGQERAGGVINRRWHPGAGSRCLLTGDDTQEQAAGAGVIASLWPQEQEEGVIASLCTEQQEHRVSSPRDVPYTAGA